MNTTHTYIHTDKSLNSNQVFSGSASGGAENQTPGMWLEGRETGPINPHVPYLAITASNWPLGHCLKAAATQLLQQCWWEGWGMSNFTKQVQDWQKQSKFFPSASLLLSIKAGWPCHGKISRRFILSRQSNGLIHCANDDLSMSPQGKIKLVIFYSTSNASY